MDLAQYIVHDDRVLTDREHFDGMFFGILTASDDSSSGTDRSERRRSLPLPAPVLHSLGDGTHSALFGIMVPVVLVVGGPHIGAYRDQSQTTTSTDLIHGEMRSTMFTIRGLVISLCSWVSSFSCTFLSLVFSSSRPLTVTRVVRHFNSTGYPVVSTRFTATKLSVDASFNYGGSNRTDYPPPTTTSRPLTPMHQTRR